MHPVRALVPTVLCCLVAGAAARAQAQTVQLGSARDNTLYESPTGALSNGAGDGMFAGLNNNGAIRRALVRFDCTAIPPGSTVTAVSLQLTVTMTSATPTDVALHRALADWGEGTSVAPMGGGGGTAATPNDATWLHRFLPNDLWAAVGGDYDPNSSGSITTSGLGVHVWPSTPQLVADVQSWVDAPAGNFGWLLRSPEAPTDRARKFATREAATVADRPVLTVAFTPPPATFAAFGAGCNGSAGVPTLAAQAGSRPALGGSLALAVTNVPPAAAMAIGVLGLSTTANASPLGSYALPFDLTPIGMTGCTQLVSDDATYLLPVVGGQAVWTLPIPNALELLLLPFHVQALVPDAAANAFGATTANAGSGVIGS